MNIAMPLTAHAIPSDYRLRMPGRPRFRSACARLPRCRSCRIAGRSFAPSSTKSRGRCAACSAPRRTSSCSAARAPAAWKRRSSTCSPRATPCWWSKTDSSASASRRSPKACRCSSTGCRSPGARCRTRPRSPARVNAKAYRAVVVVHNESATGVVADLAAIGDVLRDSETLLVVDSVSGVGGVEMRMDEWGVDVVVTASQKSLMCPPGLVIAAVSAKAMRVVRPRTASRASIWISAAPRRRSTRARRRSRRRSR